MTTIRVAKRKRFTMIDRETVTDSSLSFRARGVLFWMLDKPDDWHFDSDTISHHGTEGRDAIRSALKELAERGYLVREQYRDQSGKWATLWTTYERPHSPQRETSDGKPATVFQALITKKTDTDIRNETKLSVSEPDPDCQRENVRAIRRSLRNETPRAGGGAS